MNNTINEELLKIAFENKIGLISTDKLGPDVPSVASFKFNAILLNINWQNSKEITFIIAHELAHFMNGHVKQKELYYTPSKLGIEGEANKTAIHLLLDLYKRFYDHDNLTPLEFMNMFSIPSFLEDNVIKEFNSRR